MLGLICLAAVGLERILAPAIAVPARSRHAQPFSLCPWRLPAEALCWLVLAFLLFLPFAALLGAAATRAYGERFGLATLSLTHFRSVLLAEAATERAFLNSTLLALFAGGFLTLLAVAAAHRAEAGSRLMQ